MGQPGCRWVGRRFIGDGLYAGRGVVLIVLGRDARVIVIAIVLMLGHIDDRADEGIGGVRVPGVMQEPIYGRDGRLDDEQGHEHDGQRPHATT